MSADRLKADLVESGTMGRVSPIRVERRGDLDPKNGLTRPAGTQENKKIRDYAVRRMKEAGLEVQIDEIGNIFGRKKGSKTNKGTVMVGSHLDSVINGGMFDGALGVFGALEAVGRINDEGFENERPVEVVAFTGEEGSAFHVSLLGSLVLIGNLELDKALGMKNDEGITLKDALEAIGHRGNFHRSLDNVEYMVELHIEQGPVLDKEKISIGILENITGMTWVTATIEGEENHAGTTPMRMRADALVAAADIIRFVHKRVNEMVSEFDGSAVATVGKLNVFPNGINIVPGRVEMGIDIRDVVEKNMRNLTQEIIETFKSIEDKYYGVRTNVEISFVHSPTPLSEEVARIIEESTEKAGVTAKRMNSGAGHDAQNMAKKVKTGMIFVPSVDGISHAPTEWTNWNDIENGVKVLTQTLKKLSKT